MSRVDDLDPILDEFEPLVDGGDGAPATRAARHDDGGATATRPAARPDDRLDLEAGLRTLERLVSEAKAVPMSASALVNRAEVLEVVHRLQASLPDVLREARRVTEERDAILEAAHREAERVVANADHDRSAMLDRTEVVQAAAAEADRLLAAARESAAHARDDVDDYVDAKLANFEVVLLKTLGAVQKGRERLNGTATDDLSVLDGS